MIFAVALLMLMGVAAIVVDLGHAYVVRREIQKAAEAGVNAGVRALALPDSTSFPNWNNALTAAKATVQGNSADGALLNDFNADNSLEKIQTGFWDLNWTKDTAPANLNGYLDPAAYYAATFDPTHERAAVKVTIGKTNAGTGTAHAISTFFASAMGIGTMEVRSSVVAILETPPPTTIPQNSPVLPFATPQSFVNSYLDSGETFKIYSDHNPAPGSGGDNGGQWTSLMSQDNSDKNLKDLINKGNDTPLTVGVDSIYIVPGTKANLFDLVAQDWGGKTLLLTVVGDDYLSKEFTRILALVPFFVSGIGGHGSNSYIEGHFVKNFALNNGGVGGSSGGGAPPVFVPVPKMVF